jgi:hypothetical protein
MNIIGVIVAPSGESSSASSAIIGVALIYPLLVFAIWFVNDTEYVTKIFNTMFDGSVTGFVAANIIVIALGSVCLFFGIILRLLGMI